MGKKQIEQPDRALLKEYSKNIWKDFIPPETGIAIGETRVFSHWLIAQTHRTYAHINVPSLKEIFEEKVSEEEIIDLQNRLNSIQEIMTERFDILNNKIDELSGKIESIGKKEEKVVLLRTMSKKEARNEIMRLFKTGEALDYGIIAEKLQLSLSLVVDICNELEEEGEIGEAG